MRIYKGSMSLFRTPVLTNQITVFVTTMIYLVMNLKDRVVYGHGVRDAVELAEHSSSRPSKYKSWDEVKMAQAFTSVTQERMSIREAAIQYGVPKSTLGDHLSGATSGPQMYLDKSAEEELVQFLLRSAEIGYAKSHKQVVRRLLQYIEIVVKHGGIRCCSTSPGQRCRSS